MAISAAQQAILDEEQALQSKDQIISADQQAMIYALPKPSISEPGSGAYTE